MQRCRKWRNRDLMIVLMFISCSNWNEVLCVRRRIDRNSAYSSERFERNFASTREPTSVRCCSMNTLPRTYSIEFEIITTRRWGRRINEMSSGRRTSNSVKNQLINCSFIPLSSCLYRIRYFPDLHSIPLLLQIIISRIRNKRKAKSSATHTIIRLEVCIGMLPFSWAKLSPAARLSTNQRYQVNNRHNDTHRRRVSMNPTILCSTPNPLNHNETICWAHQHHHRPAYCLGMRLQFFWPIKVPSATWVASMATTNNMSFCLVSFSIHFCLLLRSVPFSHTFKDSHKFLLFSSKHYLSH